MKANKVYSKAVEFVKQHGWEYAKHILTEDSVILVDLDYKHLKHLIESYELVERYGTADEAKEYLPMLRMGSYDELKQAIEDVESCL